MPTSLTRRRALGGLAALGFSNRMSAEAGTAGTSPIADRLAVYAEGLQFADLRPVTVETVKIHLLDALGCGIAAFDEEPVRMCRSVAAAAPGQATLIGSREKATTDLAAFANGAAIRYFDLNDVYVGLEPGHPSDNITACLAAGEAEQASGQDLITAIALAYEIDCRLLDAAEVTGRGWDHPIYSLPAAALAAGKLMKLSAPKLTQAVNIAINAHIPMNQTRVQVLSDWKGLADADATRNGVFAAELARAGLTGPAPIFEGRVGLFKQVTGPFEIDTGAFGGAGRPFKIVACSIKPYPAQAYSLTAIPAGIAVAKDAGNLDHIKSIEIATTRLGFITAGRDPEKWTPDTKETADHSLPYIAARAMFDGDITNDSYLPEKIHDPKIRAFMQKITVKEDPALTALQPQAIPNRITAMLEDGRTISHQVNDMPGFASRPMQRADVEHKFRGIVGKRYSDAQIQAIFDAVWNLDRETDLGRFAGLFALGA
jgi:2-methylcitrate dehydratase